MKERVSALLDGALDEESTVRMLDHLKRDGALRRDWEHFCLVGDALRGDEPLALDVTRSVMLRLEDEPTVLAPAVRREGSGFFRHLMPLAASLMGVAAVGWVAGMFSGGGDALHFAKVNKSPALMASVTPATSGQSLVMPTSVENSNREYLFAHQSLAPSAAMPGVALYVRTVADTAMPGQR